MAFDPVRALELASAGKSMRQMGEAMGCTIDEIYRYRAKHTHFEQSFTQARTNGLELLADDLITIDSDVSDVMKARLRSENLRWLLSRRLPQNYGDRISVDVGGVIDLRAALNDANRRIALQAPVDAQFTPIPAPIQPADAPAVLPARLAELME